MCHSLEFKKLKAQMSMFLEHVKLWMLRSVAETEDRVERRMETMMYQKSQTIHKLMYAFELIVLA